MFRKVISFAVLSTSCFALVACSGSSGNVFDKDAGRIDAGVTPESSLVVLNANGDLPDNGITTGPGTNSANLKRIDNDVGFAYQMGRVGGTDRYLGVAGVLPNSQVGSAPIVATASYRGAYNVAYADRTSFEPSQSGTITLNADFTQRTLVGQSGALAVNGSINGQTLGGTASYRGVDAPLTGRIGNDRAVGAFAGNTENATVVGGFIAKRQP